MADLTATQILPRNAPKWCEQSPKVGKGKPNGSGHLAINAHRLHREIRGWAAGSNAQSGPGECPLRVVRRRTDHSTDRLALR